MRCTSNLLVPVMALLSGVACVAALAQMPTYNRGRTPSAEEIRAWDISIGPEGKELPAGSATAKDGAKVFAQRCAKCHGLDGKYQWPGRAHPPSGGLTPILAGEKGTVEQRQFATTIWDYVNRAMPEGLESGSLSADEVYGVTAYLLYLDGIIKEGDVMNAQTLPKVRMPKRPPAYK